MKSKRTKATDIPKRVKDVVWERDNHCCILCKTPYAMPNAHYIARSQGGLGIEQNIVTLCLTCHNEYDNSERRNEIKVLIQKYLKNKYRNWNEQDLIYKKGETK